MNNSLIHHETEWQDDMFNQMAVAEGKDATWTAHTNLSKSLQYHYDKVYEQGTDLRPSSAVQENHTEKRLSNGHILLYRNGVCYTLLGTRYL